MSRYMFKILVLGDPNIALPYMSTVFGEAGENKETYKEWYKEITALENTCDLEVDVITDLISTNFDEMIPIVDGIIYFLNPLLVEQFEFFEIIYPIINSVKRDIPCIIMFYDINGIIPLSVNTLLENVWVNFPSLEAFVNLPPKEFHQVFQCICLSMIMGDTPLNIENAWLRYPILIKLANFYYEQQNFYYAAQAMRKAEIISEIYNKGDYYILCEQTAYLYARNSLFLEASNILKKVDSVKSFNFKKLYAESIIREGNKLFNKGDYEKAAKQYESAAQWSSIELMEKTVIQESFKLAINSWISACNTKESFRILERLPHEDMLSVLNEITDKIVSSANYLDSVGNLELAKDQLYLSINMYQKEGLFTNVEKFALKLIDVLIKSLERDINNKDNYLGKKAYDEIENLWESFKLQKKNLDPMLHRLIKLFIEELDFATASNLINKLSSLELKKQLTEFSYSTEEKEKNARKQEIESNLEKGVSVLQRFIDAEQKIVLEINDQKNKEVEEMVHRQEFLKANELLMGHAFFIKTIGKEDIADIVLSKSMDLLVDGKLFEEFINAYDKLSGESKKTYLLRVFPVLKEKLKDIMDEREYEKTEKIFDNISKMYRSQMHYEESKEISQLFIKLMKKQALKTVQQEQNLNGINKALELIKKANNISSSYLDDAKLTFNKLYKHIAEIQIVLGDLAAAQVYIDKIEKKEYQSEIHKKLGKLEASKSAEKIKKVEDSIKSEFLKEKLSLVKKKATDALHDRENELKQRIGLKRAYFIDALDALKKNDSRRALEQYSDIVIRLNKIRKYNLSSVSLVVACLLLMKENRTEEIAKLLEKVKTNLASSEKLFSETFPVTLMEYLLELNKLQDDQKMKEALSFIENLPLFEEEMILLYDLIGKEYKKEEKPEKPSVDLGEIAKIRSEMYKIAKEIKKDTQDVAKRKMMRRQYWERALETLSKNNLSDAVGFYFDAVSKLGEKSVKHSAIGLILGSIALVKEKDAQVARSTFNELVKKHFSKKEELENLPEIKILKYLFLAYEKGTKDLIQLSINTFIDKLILLEPEIDFLKSLIEEKPAQTIRKELESRKEKAEYSKLAMNLDQTAGFLQQKIGDIKRDSADFLTKRKAMRKRYYDEILDLIKKKSYKEASLKYFKLSENLFARKDFQTNSLIILLYGLSLLKHEANIENVKSEINKFFDSLGLNKKLVADSFFVKLLLFLIEVKLNKFDQHIPNIKKMFEVLPLFDEEKELIKIE